jgi:hypothetical protein
MKIQVNRKDAITIDVNDKTTWPEENVECYIWPKNPYPELFDVMYFGTREDLNENNELIVIPMWGLKGSGLLEECENGDQYIPLTLDTEKATVYKADDKSSWPEPDDYCVIWPQTTPEDYYFADFYLDEDEGYDDDCYNKWYSDEDSDPCMDGDRYMVIEVKE